MKKYKIIKQLGEYVVYTAFKIGSIVLVDKHGNCFYENGENYYNKLDELATRYEIEEVKQTPYEYLLEYYGLEEGKKYESDSGCEMHVNNIYYYSSLTVKEMLLGDFVFKEIKPIITVEYSTTDEQHAKIKEMLGES